MFKFILKVRHDEGVYKISTYARNAEAAKGIIMSSFNFPNGAIIDCGGV